MPKQEGFAPGAYNKKYGPESSLTLQLDVPAPRLPQIALCAGKKEVIDPLNLRNLRSVKLRQRLTKCRDRHRRARPIICVPFWAVMSSFCASISLFLSLPPFLLYRHRLRPVHKRADQVQGAHFGLKKSCQKMTKNNFYGFSLFSLCLVRIFVFYRLTIETKVEKMAANTKVCTFEWPGLYKYSAILY